jgi:hypothetical protein
MLPEYAAGVPLESESPLTAEHMRQLFYKGGKVPTCVNEGDYLLDNYCEKRSDNNQMQWTSRTKLLAMTLADIAGNDDHVLYCSTPDDTLVEYEETLITGSEAGEVRVSADGEELPAPLLCFPTLANEPARSIVNNEENHCVNNFCILKHDGSTTVAVSLNQEMKDNTFVEEALGVNPQLCIDAANGRENEFVRCSNTNQLWYHKNLNLILYNKEGINLRPNLVIQMIEEFFDWISGFFTQPEEEEEALSGFINQPGQFRKFFSLKSGEKAVRGVSEFIPGKDTNDKPQQTLVVEYEHFATDICQYVNHVEDTYRTGNLGQSTVTCTEDETIQKVIAVDQTDFWWPRLTGSLRVSEEES